MWYRFLKCIRVGALNKITFCFNMILIDINTDDENKSWYSPFIYKSHAHFKIVMLPSYV